MRLHDVITPKDLSNIFHKELCEIHQLGQRDDLIRKWIKSLADCISRDYFKVCINAVPDELIATQMWRMLCLIDRFLEEKYASNSTTS